MMDLDFNLDAAMLVGTETVTLETVRATGTMRASVFGAFRTAVSYKEQQPSFGVYVGGDLSFRIAARSIPAGFLPLKPRDRVTDAAGVVYTVLQVQPGRHTVGGPQSFKLMVRDLKIAFDLKDLITIEEPQRQLDAAKAKKVVSWAAKYKLLPARVQLESEATADMAGKRVTQGTYRVFLDREVVVTHEDRIKWIPGLVLNPVTHVLAAPDITDVRFLEIVGYHNAESIQELPTVDARSSP